MLTLGPRGLYDGLTGTLLRQMTYSMARFAAYDWAKGVVHTGQYLLASGTIDVLTVATESTPMPAYKMALAGSMAGGIAGVLGNPAEIIMVRMQGDKAKPLERESSVRLGVCS